MQAKLNSIEVVVKIKFKVYFLKKITTKQQQLITNRVNVKATTRGNNLIRDNN